MADEASPSCPVPNHRGADAKVTADPSACPVDHSSKKSSCPVDHKSRSAQAMLQLAQGGNGCGSGDESSYEANNPANQMPSSLSQLPSPGQRIPLSTSRAVSTIPKGDFKPSHQLEGTDTWTYPSPQQFYNAMKRKGYKPQEIDMGSVVAIHNTVNERVWKQVMEYESFHLDSCPNPRLEKFSGKANDLSLKARLRTWTGSSPPFDRHDWVVKISIHNTKHVVDRCGKKVRYIIDFYAGMPVAGKPMSIYTDTRPAADSPSALLDRMKMMVGGQEDHYFDNSDDDGGGGVVVEANALCQTEPPT